MNTKLIPYLSDIVEGEQYVTTSGETIRFVMKPGKHDFRFLITAADGMNPRLLTLDDCAYPEDWILRDDLTRPAPNYWHNNIPVGGILCRVKHRYQQLRPDLAIVTNMALTNSDLLYETSTGERVIQANPVPYEDLELMLKGAVKSEYEPKEDRYVPANLTSAEVAYAQMLAGREFFTKWEGVTPYCRLFYSPQISHDAAAPFRYQVIAKGPQTWPLSANLIDAVKDWLVKVPGTWHNNVPEDTGLLVSIGKREELSYAKSITVTPRNSIRIVDMEGLVDYTKEGEAVTKVSALELLNLLQNIIFIYKHTS